MKNCAALIFLISTAALGALYLDGQQKLDVAEAKLAALEATKTTDAERARYGQACLDWHKQEGEKDGKRDGEFFLGRSWKKHGQLVFEVVMPKDEIGKRTGDAICTYDVQSGMMYSYTGGSREIWMFY